MYWLDYSAASLPGSVIRAAGYPGVIRYIDAPARLGRKHTNPAEYQSDIAAGIDVRLVMEVSTGDANGGYARGVEYAQRAQRGAAYIGYVGVVYFCNDSPTLSSSTLWDDYLTGAASVLGWPQVGAYGFANAMDVAAHMTECVHFWQAGRRSDVRPFVQLWQDNNQQVTVGGVTCDRNLVLIDLAPTESDDVSWDEIIAMPGGNAFPARDVLAYADYYAGTAASGVARLEAKVDALSGTLSEHESRVLAAIRAADENDARAVAEQLAPLLPALPAHLSDGDFARLADAVNDENDRRAAARAGTEV